jgi:hypothetical protein
MAKPVLANDEKETLISFDETPAEAVVFTYNKRWQQHLEKRLGLKSTFDNGFGGKEYHIAKSRIRPPLAPRKLSKEARERLRQRAQSLHKSSPKSPNHVPKHDRNHVLVG